MRPDQRRRQIAQRLGAVRHQGEVAVGEMAALARVHVRDVQRFESGEHAVPVAYVLAVAERFDVTTDYLLGRTDVPKPWEAVPAASVPSGLLRDAILLTHPDRHPSQRWDQATRVTQELNALLDEHS